MFHRDGRPMGYDYQRSGIASVTIRPQEAGEGHLLSRDDTLRVIQSVRDDKTRAGEKKD